MSENEGIQPEIPKDSNDASVTEPTDSTTKSSTSDDVHTVETVKDESETASVVSEAKASASDPKENADSRENTDARVSKSRYKFDLMKASYLHCPFVWQKDLNISAYNDHDIDLISSTEEMFDDLGFHFRGFIIHLVLCYHNFYKRNIKDCIQHLDELENIMKYSSKKHSRDYLFNLINDALYHVIHSCRIYILQTTDQNERAEQILRKIKSYDAMNDANKAGLWAIRANVYVEYGYEGVKNAVSYMSRAVNLDPENAFWHFMKGMFMGRLRRMEGGLVMPQNEEFESLRAAIKKREEAAFIAFAAETYSEVAKVAKKLCLQKTKKKDQDKDTEKSLVKILQELNEVAAKYFKASIELKPNSSHLLFRCGKGLINLPPPHQDIKKGLDFIRKGLEMSPDSGYGNHAMAMYLEKIEKNSALAKKYLDISVKKKNFQAHVDMIRIEFLESKDAGKLWKELEQLLELYPDMPKKRKILGEMVCYHLFVVYDLVEACFFMKNLVKLNSTAVDAINSHKTMILPINPPIPLSDLIMNRIKASLNNRKLNDLCREVFKKYVQFLIEEDIVPNKIPDSAFSKVQQLIELGYKNKKMKPVDEQVRDAQKRVHNTNEFEAAPCAEDELEYLNFYKNDLKDARAGRIRGEGDEMIEMLHKMGQNPLPKRRMDEDTTKGESRRHSTKSSRSSRKHLSHRSYSSSSTNTQSSSDHKSSRKHRRSSRSGRHRHCSPSYQSSYSSSSSDSYSSNSSDRHSSSSSDRHSRSQRRDSHRRGRSSRSYDNKYSSNKHRHRGSGSDSKGSSKQKRKRDSSSSPSNSSSSESSASSRSDRTLNRSTQEKEERKEQMSGQVGAEAASEVSQLSDCVPKAVAEPSVDRIQVSLDNLSIDNPKSSRKSSPQRDVADAFKTLNTLDLVGAEASNQRGDECSNKAKGTLSTKESGKHEEDREDSDRSVRTTTSRTSGAIKRTSKRESRDKSLERVRTNSSHSFKKESKSSRRRRSRSSSNSSSSGERSSERSSGRRHKKSEQRQTESPNLTKKGDTKRRSSGQKDDHGKKNRDLSVEIHRSTEKTRKHSSKYERRKEDASGSNADSSSTSRRDYSAEERAERRSLPKESKHSKEERRRRPRKEKYDNDRSP